MVNELFWNPPCLQREYDKLFIFNQKKEEIYPCIDLPVPEVECSMLREILQIVQILVSAEGLLVDLKMPKTDEIYFDSVEFVLHSFRIAILIAYSLNGCHHLNPDWWHTHPNDLVWFHKYFRR